MNLHNYFQEEHINTSLGKMVLTDLKHSYYYFVNLVNHLKNYFKILLLPNLKKYCEDHLSLDAEETIIVKYQLKHPPSQT